MMGSVATAEMRTMGCGTSAGENTEEQEVSLTYIKFEMPVKYLSRNVKKTVGCADVELRGKRWVW